MPRAQLAKLGQDGFERDPVGFELEAGQVGPLYSLLGSGVRVDQNVLALEIVEIGRRFQRWNGRGPAAFSRAQACASLQKVLASPSIDGLAVLSMLNGRAFDLVFNELLLMKLPQQAGGKDLTPLLEEDLVESSALRAACKKVHNDLAAIKGPDAGVEIAACVHTLCSLYEAGSGRSITLSNKGEHLAYTAEAKSMGARFVHGCFEMIDSTVRPETINTHMRSWIERRAVHSPRS